MRFDSLRAELGFASMGMMVMAVGSGACGGNVVVDGATKVTSGTGGSGGQTTIACGCNQFCATVSPCGAPADADKCVAACPTLPSSVVACVCGTPPGDCLSVKNCFGG